MGNTMTTRREFLKSTAQTATAVGVASACASCAWFNSNDIQVEAKPDAKEIALPFAKHPKLREPNGVVNIEARDGDLRLVVVRLPDGKPIALSMECTHWGCDVDWDAAKQRFDCPCHGSKFDIAGKVLEGPADEPLPAYPVTETEEGLVVGFERIAPS